MIILLNKIVVLLVYSVSNNTNSTTYTIFKPWLKNKYEAQRKITGTIKLTSIRILL